MENELQYEDLLIKLRAKLNDEKIKLWEAPYILPDRDDISQNLRDLATKFATELSAEPDAILHALHDLQLHSIERCKANAEFKETGCASFRIKVTMPGQKPRVLKVQKKLDVLGSDLIKEVADELSVGQSRVKLIYNGKVIKATPSLEEQGVRNAAQILAMIMTETPEEVKKEDNMYLEMKATRDDALLLSESVDDLADDDEYIKLEDQSGKTVELPPLERRALLVGLALHERGRAAAKLRDYPLALVLLLEADRTLSECSSAILKTVDNWAVLQLDISWCYLCVRALAAAADAAARLQRAEHALRATYGENHQRLIAVKGTAANERVLFMRLYLLQGIVAYHQNKRAEAKELLEKAENELNFLRVDDTAVTALMELGWTRGQARAGLRASGGSLDRAHHYLADKRTLREQEREKHRRERQRLVEALVGMGYPRRLAAKALRMANNHVADAVRLIQDHPEQLHDNDDSSEDSESGGSSSSSLVEPDEKLVTELMAMGYDAEDARAALKLARNLLGDAVELLVAAGGHLPDEASSDNPSTSAGGAPKKKLKKHKRDKKKKEREQALKRLTSAIKLEEDDHLDASLVEEEEFLAQYKSLL